MKAQYQLDLDRCCGPCLKPKKYLTGLQKEAAEQTEAKEMWTELNRGDRQ